MCVISCIIIITYAQRSLFHTGNDGSIHCIQFAAFAPKRHRQRARTLFSEYENVFYYYSVRIHAVCMRIDGCSGSCTRQTSWFCSKMRPKFIATRKWDGGCVHVHIHWTQASVKTHVWIAEHAIMSRTCQTSKMLMNLRRQIATELPNGTDGQTRNGIFFEPTFNRVGGSGDDDDGGFSAFDCCVRISIRQ